MPKRNPMALALRTMLYRTRRTKTKAEKIRQVERRHGSGRSYEKSGFHAGKLQPISRESVLNISGDFDDS